MLSSSLPSPLPGFSLRLSLSREALSVSLLSLAFSFKDPSRAPWRTRHSHVAQTRTSVQMRTSGPEKGLTKEGGEVWPSGVWPLQFGAWSGDGCPGALWVRWRRGGGWGSGESRVQAKGSKKRGPTVDGPKVAKIRVGQLRLAKLGYGLLCSWASALHTRVPEHVTKQPSSTLIQKHIVQQVGRRGAS